MRAPLNFSLVILAAFVGCACRGQRPPRPLANSSIPSAPSGVQVSCPPGMALVRPEPTALANGIKAFCLDVREVLGAGYLRCVEAGACHGGCFNKAPDEYPVACVTWADADRYCARLGRRLPTLAEFDLARRRALESSTACGCTGRTEPCVPDTTVSAAGRIEDLNGNLAEWTSTAVDDSIPRHFVAGGYFAMSCGLAKHASPSPLRDDASVVFVGFRCAANL
jgi:formylglycine-generating enzyme required for sulfatase activity